MTADEMRQALIAKEADAVLNDEKKEHSLIVRPQQGLTVQASALAARGLAALEVRPKPKGNRVAVPCLVNQR